jgi:hypothetical protein
MFGRDLRRAQWLARVGSRAGSLYRNYGPGSGKFAIGGSAAGLGRTYQHMQRKSAIKRKMQRAAGKPRASKRRKTGPPSAGTVVEPQGNSKGYTKLPTGKCYIAKSVLDALANNHYVTNGGVQMTCGVGVQSGLALIMGNTTDLNSLASKVQVGSASTAEQMFLQSMTAELQIRSACTYTSNLTVYDIVPRRDCYTAVIGDPLTAWSTGIVDELAAGLYTDIGSTPIQSDLFCQFFEIVNTHKVEILPGGTYTHKVYSEPNIKLHNEVLSRVTSAIRKVTVFTLLVLSGGPAHDSTTKTQVSSSAASLDIIQKKTYNVKYLLDNTTSYFRNISLPTSFTVGAEVVNEELGELQNAAGINADIGAY